MLEKTKIFEEQQIVRRSYDALAYIFEKGEGSMEAALSKDCGDISRLAAKYRLYKRVLVDDTVFSAFGFSLKKICSNTKRGVWRKRIFDNYYLQISPMKQDDTWEVRLLKKAFFLYFPRKRKRIIFVRTIEDLEESFRLLGFYVEPISQI